MWPNLLCQVLKEGEKIKVSVIDNVNMKEAVQLKVKAVYLLVS